MSNTYLKQDNSKTVEENITDRVNDEIKWSVKHRKSGNERAYELLVARIDGLVTALALITGKDYRVTDSGLKEYEENDD